ncbi:MAG: hypothetical protein V3U80_03410 [Flavobacteriaceae bacterium]
MIRLIITIALTILMSFGIFAQSKTPTTAKVEQLMAVKQGMKTVNNITAELAEGVSAENFNKFQEEMADYKSAMLKTAMETFKNDYSASDIDAIYTECTSDAIDYSDKTNNFFKKWRKLKATFYRNAKQAYFRHKA